MRPILPRGFRDVITTEAREREEVVRALSSTFAAWGYEPIETPVVEDLRVVEQGMGGTGEETFRLIDADGSLLALRPEMTIPIARAVAMRLAHERGPHRVRYVAPVFRERASLRGQARQFTQVGLELIGAREPAADAEVIALAVEGLRAAGLERFTVQIGSVRLLHDLLERADGSASWRAAVLAAAHNRNVVEIDRLASEPSIPPAVKEALTRCVRLRGGRAVLDEAEALLRACGLEGTLLALTEAYDILVASGLGPWVAVDLGLMRSFDYYTGMVFDVYAPGLGLAIGGGGRYDRMLAVFEHGQPAAGFAIGLERLMITLAEHGGTPRVSRLDAVVGGTDARAVFAWARELRAAGWNIALACGLTGTALVEEARRVRATEALVADDAVLYRLDRAGAFALTITRPVSPPPAERTSPVGGDA